VDATKIKKSGGTDGACRADAGRKCFELLGDSAMVGRAVGIGTIIANK